MKKRLLRPALVALAAIAAGSGGFAVSPSTAQTQSSAVYAWGISTQGETCGGTCGTNMFCCKITIVDQEKPAQP